MASGLRYDPYSQPKQFMDSIIADMKQVFVERIADVKNEVSAKLAEVDSALAGGKTLKEAQAIAEEFLGERKAHAWDGVQFFGNAVSEQKAKIAASIPRKPQQAKRRWVSWGDPR